MRASAPSTNPMKQQKPLDIPEIRTNVGWYLDPSDVYSCALVCRDWAQTFIPLLWHTIDFSLKPQIPLCVLKKHARHIRRLEYLELSEKGEDTVLADGRWRDVQHTRRSIEAALAQHGGEGGQLP